MKSVFGSSTKNIKYTGIIETCPYCHNTTELVRCKSMRWTYLRCQVCLLAKDTKLWNQLRHGYRIYNYLPI